MPDTLISISMDLFLEKLAQVLSRSFDCNIDLLLEFQRIQKKERARKRYLRRYARHGKKGSR